MRTGKDRSTWFSSLTERESDWVLMLFRGLINYPREREEVIPLIGRKLFLDDIIDNLAHENKIAFTEEDKDICSNQVISRCRSSVIPQENFNWLSIKNERQIYWAWLFIKDHYQNLNTNKFPIDDWKLNNQLLKLEFNDVDNTLYSSMQSNSKERRNWLIKVIDFDKYTSPVDKINMLTSMKLQWAECFERNDFKWIEKSNDNQISWLWDYLKGQNVIIIHSMPVDITERYLAIIGVFDFWNGHPAELKLLIDSAKRAWSQKKHRDKRGDKKAYNFVLSSEAKSKLDKIAKHKDKNLSSTIESLIFNELERINSSGI